MLTYSAFIDVIQILSFAFICNYWLKLGLLLTCSASLKLSLHGVRPFVNLLCLTTYKVLYLISIML